MPASNRPERSFDAVRQVVEATGVLKGRTRRALDSTLLDDAVATQDTVTQLISAIRRVRREVPAAAPVTLCAHDYDQGAKPVIAWDDSVARQQLVSALVNDALALLEAAKHTELTIEQDDAVGLLALVAGQDVAPDKTEGTWRIAERVAADRVISTVDPEARHLHNSQSTYRDGDKAHLGVEPDTGLVTAAASPPQTPPPAPPGSPCWTERDPGWRCWPTRPTAPGRPERRWPTDSIGRSSNQSRFAPPSLAGSPSTTSPSTPPHRPSPVRKATPSR